MVAALVTPIGEVFWMLFSDDGGHFIWNPNWTSTSWYPLVGLVIIVPCVYIYNIYGEKSFEKKLDEERLSAKQQLLAAKSLNADNKSVNSKKDKFSDHRTVSISNENDMSLHSDFGGSLHASTPLDTPNRLG